MRLNGRQIGVLVAILLPLVAAGGCTGTDLLTPGNGNFTTRVELDNTGGRFVDGGFDSALLQIRQMEVRPTDPAADAATGPNNLGLLRDGINANFQSGTPAEETILLTSGQYKLVTINYSQIVLNDVDDLTVAGLSDPINPTCHDFVKRFAFSAPINIFDFNLDDEVFRFLDADNSGALTVRVDYPNYLDALFASIDCASCVCPAAYTPNNIPRSCLGSGQACSVDADCPGTTCEDCVCLISPNSDFDRTVFANLTSDYLTFE